MALEPLRGSGGERASEWERGGGSGGGAQWDTDVRMKKRGRQREKRREPEAGVEKCDNKQGSKSPRSDIRGIQNGASG